MNAPDLPRLEAAESLARLAEMPGFLAAALAGRDAVAQAWQPEPGQFSLVEHACHLRDLEREGYHVRLARMLEEDVPELAGFDGGGIAAARDYPAQDALAAAEDFARARRELLQRVSSLDSALFCREAVFAGQRITLAGLLAMMAGHDGEHRREIAQLLTQLDSR